MKRISAVTIAIFGLLVLGAGLWPSVTRATSRRESVVVEFNETVKLTGVLLRGQYLIVHDEERMARGEPCTWVYAGKEIDESKVVASFHCIHVDREKTDTLKVSFKRSITPYETPEIMEIQFAGSTDGHKVPLNGE